MSRHHIEKVTCPSCHHEGDFELWDSINTALDPEMKEKVLNQSIFLYTCPSCGETFRLNYSTLYHQMEDLVMIYLVPESEVKKTYEIFYEKNALADYRTEKYLYRIVTSANQLVEKIQIFDAGKDDRVMELVKLLVTDSLHENNPDKEFDELRFAVDDNGTNILIIINKGEITGAVDIDNMYEFASSHCTDFKDLRDDEDIVIKSRMLTRQVEAAQKRVEGNNYDTRKQVLQYDDVMREQREIIYAERYDVITAERDLEPEIKAMIKRTINRTVDGHSRNDQEEALKGILNFARQALVPENAISLEDLREVGEVTKRSVNYDAIKVYLNELAADVYDRQIKKLRSEEAIREFQKVLILMVVDNKWTDHIDALDQLRNAVGLRGYAQNNPIVEYQSEGFKMFQDMIGAIEYDVTRTMMKAQIHEQSRENVNERVSTTATGNIQAHQADANGQEIDFSKVGRNDFCPCGSGKKFKNCHGRKQF